VGGGKEKYGVPAIGQVRAPFVGYTVMGRNECRICANPGKGGVCERLLVRVTFVYKLYAARHKFQLSSTTQKEIGGFYA
jgi:hypothetical protein